MNRADDQLNRLFQAAAQARSEPAPAPPYGLETRVMAAWRAGQPTENGFWDMALLLRGLIVAGLIMAISFWPALTSTGSSASTSNPFAEFLQLADSTIPSNYSP
ncbi:MAG: hypothetical protein LV480_13685 [Methylacidiphilales bacterium]|nr:hypothetical protein [Candidatus Methylacidiphilales bacterium]